MRPTRPHLHHHHHHHHHHHATHVHAARVSRVSRLHRPARATLAGTLVLAGVVVLSGCATSTTSTTSTTSSTRVAGTGSSVVGSSGSSSRPYLAPGATPPSLPTPTPSRNSHPPILSVRHIVFIGDSLTEGAFATTQAEDYASRTTAYLGATALDTAGHYGWTTENTVQALQATPAPSGADLVVVELGTNDVGPTSLADFSTQYANLIALLKQDEPTATRWACLGTWRDPNQDGTTPAGAPYDNIIAADCPGTFVSIGEVYMDFTLHGPQGRTTWLGTGDWFHPNSDGHARIAAAVEYALTS